MPNISRNKKGAASHSRNAPRYIVSDESSAAEESSGPLSRGGGGGGDYSDADDAIGLGRPSRHPPHAATNGAANANSGADASASSASGSAVGGGGMLSTSSAAFASALSASDEGETTASSPPPAAKPTSAAAVEGGGNIHVPQKQSKKEEATGGGGGGGGGISADKIIGKGRELVEGAEATVRSAIASADRTVRGGIDTATGAAADSCRAAHRFAVDSANAALNTAEGTVTRAAETAISAAKYAAVALAALCSLLTIFFFLVAASAAYGSLCAATTRWFFMRGAPPPQIVVPVFFETASLPSFTASSASSSVTTSEGEEGSGPANDAHPLRELSLGMLDETAERVGAILARSRRQEGAAAAVVWTTTEPAGSTGSNAGLSTSETRRTAASSSSACAARELNTNKCGSGFGGQQLSQQKFVGSSSSSASPLSPCPSSDSTAGTSFLSSHSHSFHQPQQPSIHSAEEALRASVVQLAMEGHRRDYAVLRADVERRMAGVVGVAAVPIRSPGAYSSSSYDSEEARQKGALGSAFSYSGDDGVYGDGAVAGNGADEGKGSTTTRGAVPTEGGVYSVSLTFETAVTCKVDAAALSSLRRRIREKESAAHRKAQQNFISSFVFGSDGGDGDSAGDGSVSSLLEALAGGVGGAGALPIPMAIEASVYGSGDHHSQQGSTASKSKQQQQSPSSVTIAKRSVLLSVGVAEAVGLADALGGVSGAADASGGPIASLLALLSPRSEASANGAKGRRGGGGGGGEEGVVSVSRFVTFSFDSVLFFASLPFRVASGIFHFSLEAAERSARFAGRAAMWFFFGWARVSVTTLRSVRDFVGGFAFFPAVERAGKTTTVTVASSSNVAEVSQKPSSAVSLHYTMPSPTTVLITGAYTPTPDFLRHARGLNFTITRKMGTIADIFAEGASASAGGHAEGILAVSEVTVTSAHLTFTPHITGIQYYFYHYPFATFAAVGIVNGLLCFCVGFIATVAGAGLLLSYYTS